MARDPAERDSLHQEIIFSSWKQVDVEIEFVFISVYRAFYVDKFPCSLAIKLPRIFFLRCEVLPGGNSIIQQGPPCQRSR